MTIDRILEICKKIKKGAAYNIEYKTAVWDVNGVEYEKHVKSTVRLGIKYGNIAGVVVKGTKKPNPNVKWIVNNIVFEDSKGFKLRVYNAPIGKTTVTYYDGQHQVVPKPIMKQSNGYSTCVRSIKLENVFDIKRKGESL